DWVVEKIPRVERRVNLPWVMRRRNELRPRKFYVCGRSTAGGNVAGVCGAARNRDGGVHAHEHSGFCGQVNFFALPCEDIDSTAGEADAESTNSMAEDCAN